MVDFYLRCTVLPLTIAVVLSRGHRFIHPVSLFDDFTAENDT